ncbi:MAG: LysE family translocator [Limisphaerales bacterium]|jgi:threonine/homoserine/homoserine lactone efflux protein
MTELTPILLSALTGFVSGFLLSVPVGPVNLTIINEGARRGFKWAVLIGLGASVMDVIYCTIAFTGFSSFFGSPIVKTSMEVFSFAFMLFLGVKFLSAKTVIAPTQLGAAASRIEQRIDEKLHPHSAFMIGFARVLGNVGVLLFWIVAAAYFMSHEAYFTSYEWVEDTLAAKAAFIAGVALGANLWFCALSYGVARKRRQFSEQTLLRMERFSGICLLGIGLYDGGHIALQLARHRHGF